MRASERLLLCLLSASCATLADGAPGLDNPPSARAGPFRLIAPTEIGQSRAAPFVMDEQKRRLRDASVLDVDGDPSTLEVEGYFSASLEDADTGAPSVAIVVLPAVDGRSFARTPTEVLTPTEVWEGGTVGAPSAIRSGGAGRSLYYAAAGGIGLATSADGATFAARSAPVLGESDVSWSESAPRSPAVVQLPGGEYRLFFEADRGGVPVVGEAKSADGVAWTVFDRPAIEPGREGSIDDLLVGSPDAVLGTSSEGREILYVYYTARSSTGKHAISMAARFLADPDARLEKSHKSMYGPAGNPEPREPSVVRFDEFTFLFTTQKRTKSSTDVVVTGGVSPGLVELPEPDPG